ncbi:MAG: hypothetical protein LBK00_03535 [Treponema sp.]|jgi:hypothetical protein|nr:hypothetical protein [Treponema sp.]
MGFILLTPEVYQVIVPQKYWSGISFVFLFIFHKIIARFIIKNYDYKFTMYLKGLIPVVVTSMLFYITQDFWYIRWSIGVTLGIYLLQQIIKNKEIF